MTRGPSSISRRSWLLGTFGGLALGSGRARGDSALDAIKAQAKAAGLGPFEESESTGYRAVGDAPKAFREEALGICEGVAEDYRKHFANKKFDLVTPNEKLVVVILKGPKSYSAFEGVPEDQAGAGHFDLNANRLVMFDFGGPGGRPRAPVAQLDNTFALVHEAIHQLTFNTGVLGLTVDVPLVVTEGLATYAETWGPGNRGQIGQINLRRRAGFDQGRQKGGRWIPLERLIADDKYLDAEDEATSQIAYAESWMFAYRMLKDSARLPKFRAYLKALREGIDPKRRLEVARTHLGDLAKLDREIRSPR